MAKVLGLHAPDGSMYVTSTDGSGNLTDTAGGDLSIADGSAIDTTGTITTNTGAVTRKPFDGIPLRQIHLDHDHETNKVRGILCMVCNVGLGMLGDNADNIQRVLTYLKPE